MSEVEVELKTAIKDETVIISCISPPKYLLPFMNSKEIIFAFKQKPIQETSLYQKNFCNKFDSDTEELDYTGQPLECPFGDDDDESSVVSYIKSKGECDEYPLSLSEARKLITIYNISRLKSCNMPLCILTDGFNRDHTVIFGVSKDGPWRSRFWINQQDFGLNEAVALNVENMIKKHASLSLIKSRYTSSEVNCKYIVESVDNQATFLQESIGHIEVDIFWKTPVFSIPLKEAEIKITVNGCIGSESSDISLLWSHITLLYDYLEIIKTFKPENKSGELYCRYSINFPNIMQSEVRNTQIPDIKSVRDRLIQLVRDPNKTIGETLPYKITENMKIRLEETVANVMSGKTEQEFTDQLWTLLIECSSYTEICSCLETVFQYVRTGVCRPYVKRSNISRLSEALHRCRNDPEHFQMIFEPLELLIEIGIEKLKKQYLNMFLLGKISTRDQLFVPQLPEFPKVNAIEWMDTCSVWITWLMRVHVSLQLILLIESCLNCSSNLIPLCTSTLQHYLGHKSPIVELVNPKVITSQSFTTSANTKDLQAFLKKKMPFSSWTLKLSSEISDRKVQSIFYRNLDDLFPSSVALIDDAETENGTFLLSSLPYHCYECHIVSDLF